MIVFLIDYDYLLVLVKLREKIYNMNVNQFCILHSPICSSQIGESNEFYMIDIYVIQRKEHQQSPPWCMDFSQNLGTITLELEVVLQASVGRIFPNIR